jgi:TRAP-type transport system small permease protein
MCFRRIRKIVSLALYGALVALFLVMFGITSANVIMRYFFNKPIVIAVELGRYTFSAIVYIGVIFVMREDGHIGLDMIVNILPEKLKKAVTIFTRIVICIYLSVFSVMAVRMVLTNWINHSSTMRIPMSIPYSFMVIGGVGMLVEEFLHLIGYKDKPDDSSGKDIDLCG